MSQLTFSAVPGFFDLADSAIAGNQPLTDDSLQKISHNAKFAAVRCEIIYMGFYGSGDSVPVPVSPVDGYAYSRAECMFIPVFASSRQPAPGFVPGQSVFPTLSNVDLGSGSLVVVPYVVDVNDETGSVTCQVFFTNGGAQSQGTVKVYAVCQRSSLNQNN